MCGAVTRAMGIRKGIRKGRAQAEGATTDIDRRTEGAGKIRNGAVRPLAEASEREEQLPSRSAPIKRRNRRDLPGEEGARDSSRCR